LKTDLSKFNNSWYKPGKSLSVRLLWYFVNVIVFKSYFFPFSKLKVFILRLFGAKIGKNVIIKPNVNIKYPWRLFIDDNTWIGESVWIDNLDNVIIGKNACISQGALLLNGNHNYKKTSFDLIIKPITIKDGAWIGAKSVVTQGVIVGQHAVLTVGSVASNNLDDYGIYKGNPAIKVKTRIIE
jgi:putative colanic acid biosynthesis acetyltransferase WcaF